MMLIFKLMKSLSTNTLLRLSHVALTVSFVLFLVQKGVEAATPVPTTTAGLYTDPDNPFCLSFLTNTCDACPFSLDYYLYGNTCVKNLKRTTDAIVETPNKKTIIRTCASGCGSNACSTTSTGEVPAGLCSGCVQDVYYRYFAVERLQGYESKDWFQRCIVECSNVGAYYNNVFGNPTLGKCSECPADVERCVQLSNGGFPAPLECTYSKQRYVEAISSSFTDQAFGRVTFSSCSTRPTRTDKQTLISSGSYSQTYYVTTTNINCSNVVCDGSLQSPYPDIYYVFKHMLDDFQLGKKEEAEIFIYLMNNQSSYHTWREDTAVPSHYLRLFERTAVDVTIKPLVCDGASVTTDCYQPGEKATVILRSNRIMFFVIKTFTIKDIIFDASELIPESTCYSDYKNSTTRCCVSDGEKMPTVSNSSLKSGKANDAKCYAEVWQEGVTPTINAAWTLYKPTNDLWRKGPFAFFTMSFLRDFPRYIPTLVIEGCEFRHFWYHRYAVNMVYLDERASRLTIKDSKFHNCQFYGGMISNIGAYMRDYEMSVRESFQGRQDLIVTKFYNCTTLNASLTNCHDIKIQGSSFQESYWGNYKLLFQTSSNGYRKESYGTEGSVMMLYDFRGPIMIRDNYFKHIAGLKFSVFDPESDGNPLIETFCKTTRSPLGSSYRMSLDRHVQLVSGDELFPQLNGQYTLPRTSSLLFIREIWQGLTLYNNTFKENLGLGGTAMFILGFKNTKENPIIVEQNTFDSNFGVEFASAIAIVDMKQDYVTLKCEGIYLSNNTFINNFGCPYVKGTAVISCQPDKPSTREVGMIMNDQIKYKEAYMLGYFVSTNDVSYLKSGDADVILSRFTDMIAPEIDDLTEEIFSKFLRDIAAKKDLVTPVTHPISGNQIDINRITAIKNKFITNYASHSHLFIQGAYNTLVQENIFDSNSIPLKNFVPKFLYDIYNRNKLLRYVDDQTLPFRTTESTPLVVRMSNYIVIKDSIFTNNTQILYDAASLPFGSAITIDKHLGAADAIISNTTFHNNKGWTSSDLYQLLNFPKILLDPASMKYGLEQGVQGALIAYNYWEYMYGVQFYDPNNIPSTASGFFDLKFATPSLIIDGCTFSNNSFNVSSDGPVGKASTWTKNYRSAIVKFYNAAEGIGSTQPITGGFKNIYGSLVLQASLVYKNCVFKYNTIYDQRSFINGYGFNALFLQDSIFESNTIIDENLGSQYSLRSYLFNYYEKDVSIMNFTAQNVTFNNNKGKIAFFKEDNTINQNTSTKRYWINLETIKIFNHLSSPDFILHFKYKQYTKLSNIEAFNFTESLGLLFLDNTRNDFQVASISAKDFKVTNIGCLYMKDNSAPTSIRNYTCQNATIVPSTSTSQQVNSKSIDSDLLIDLANMPVSACFALYGTSNIDLIDFKCLSSIVIGTLGTSDSTSGNSDSTILSVTKKKIACLFQEETNNIAVTGFICRQAKAAAVSKTTEEMKVIYLRRVVYSKLVSLIFENNVMDQSLTISEADIDILDSTFTNNTATTPGSAVSSKKNTNLIINNSTFKNNTCQSCEATVFQETGTLEVDSSLFLGNEADIAAAISMSRSSTILYNSTFRENIAITRYSAVSSQLGDTQIIQSTFERNHALNGELVIYLYGGSITMQDTTISQNTAGLGALNVGIRDVPNFFIDNCTFRGLKGDIPASSTGGFIEIRESGGGIIGSTFIDASSDFGGAIYFKSDENSVLSVTNSVFKGCRAATQGEAIFAQAGQQNPDMKLIVENVSFSCGTGSNFRSNNVDLYAVYCEKMICEITDSTFNPRHSDTDTGNQLCLNQGHNHVVKGTNFTADCETLGNCDRSISSALKIYDADDVDVTEALFEGWGDRKVSDQSSTDSLGGGVSIQVSEDYVPVTEETLPVYTFTNCVWRKNQAQSGGGLYAEGDMKVIMSGGLFDGNSAANGGGIYWDSSSKQAKFVLSNGVNFINNKATVNGGAIHFLGQKVEMQDTSTVFSQNKAQYGPNIASYPTYLEIVENPDPSLYADYVAQRKQELSIARLLEEEESPSQYNRYLSDNDSNSSVYVSGNYMEPPIVIRIYDEFGQQVMTDNSSIVYSFGYTLPERTSTIVIGDPFPPVNGQIIAYPMRVFSKPGRYVTFDFILYGFDPEALGRSPEEFHRTSNASTKDVFLRRCVQGERLTDNDACEQCPNTQYTLLMESYDQCSNCPEEGICQGLNKYGPRPGYSKFSYFAVTLKQCLNDEACLGATVTAEQAKTLYCKEVRPEEPTFCYTGWCAVGYEGNLCGECQEGYAYKDSSKKTCTTCSDNPEYYILSIFVGLIGLAYIIFLVTSALKKVKLVEKAPTPKKYGTLGKTENDLDAKEKDQESPVSKQKEIEMSPSNNDSSPNEKNSNNNTAEDLKPTDINLGSIYTKIFTSYMQVLGLLDNFEFEWPQQISTFFTSEEKVSRSTAEAITLDCMLRQPFFKDLGLNSFYSKFVIMEFSPIFVTIICIITWNLLYLIKHRKEFRFHRPQLVTNTITSIVVILFILHPYILELSIDAFRCTHLADGVEDLYLTKDLSVKCWQPAHLDMAFKVAFPGLILWGIGLLVSSFIMLTCYRNELDTRIMRARYGFLYQGFSSRTYYWEYVITFRKVALICLAAFMTSYSVKIQGAIVLGINALLYVLQFKVKPYVTKTLNEMEKRSFIASTVTIYCGLFYLSNALNEATKIVFLVVIILANVYFLVFFAVEFIRDKAELLLSFPFIKKYFGRCLEAIVKFQWWKKPKKESVVLPKNQVGEEMPLQPKVISLSDLNFKPNDLSDSPNDANQQEDSDEESEIQTKTKRPFSSLQDLSKKTISNNKEEEFDKSNLTL